MLLQQTLLICESVYHGFTYSWMNYFGNTRTLQCWPILICSQTCVGMYSNP